MDSAIDKELANLKLKGTWDEVKRPVDKKAIGSRMILKLKRDVPGNIVKSMARLVAQGFFQVPGVDLKKRMLPLGGRRRSALCWRYRHSWILKYNRPMLWGPT